LEQNDLNLQSSEPTGPQARQGRPWWRRSRVKVF